MTDNDIVKALDVCNNGYCWRDGCPLASGLEGVSTVKCTSELSKAALDLINRQKAEIERLTAMVEAAEDYLRPLPFKNAFDEEIIKARAEVIKEFAEMLKKRIWKYTEYDDGGRDCTVYVVKVEDIDTIVKEMMEADNAEM